MLSKPFLIFLVVPLLPSLACADTVRLKNGDRITGKISNKIGDTLTLDTTYAGQVKIRWSEVVGIATDGPIELQLGSHQNFAARLADGGDAGLVVSDATNAMPRRTIALNDVEFINPTPDLSGKGYVYNGRVVVAASQQHGNSDTDNVHMEGEFRGQAHEHRFKLNADGTYAQDNGAESTNNWNFTGQSDWFYDPKKYYYVRTALSGDRFSDIRLRASAGGGLGYQVFDTDRRHLSVNGGLDYVSTTRISAPDESYPALGWGLDYDEWFFDHRLQVFHNEVGLYGLQAGTGLVLDAKLGVRAPIAGGVNATAQVNINWETQPAEGRKPVDTNWIFGLGYTF